MELQKRFLLADTYNITISGETAYAASAQVVAVQKKEAGAALQLGLGLTEAVIFNNSGELYQCTGDEYCHFFCKWPETESSATADVQATFYDQNKNILEDVFTQTLQASYLESPYYYPYMNQATIPAYAHYVSMQLKSTTGEVDLYFHHYQGVQL